MSSLPVVDPLIGAKLVLRVCFDNLLSLFLLRGFSWEVSWLWYSFVACICMLENFTLYGV
jgi:hypothetical protein